MAQIQKTLEEWENMVGNRWVNKFDPANPGQWFAERVRAGRKFYITPEERNLLNSDRIMDEKNDPFKNGSFRPVKDDALDDAREQEAAVAERAASAAQPNPNHMSDSELAELFKITNFKKFESAVGEITSEAVLERLLKLTEVEEYNVTVAKVNLLNSLLGREKSSAVTDGPEVTEIEQNFRVGSQTEDRATGVQPFRI